jgi:hypothetical protein
MAKLWGDDMPVCPDCGQPLLYAIDGEGECPWPGCGGQKHYDGNSMLDNAVQETTAAIDRLTDALMEVTLW